ncbi:MFS transporter [Alicyclobacillus fastidiosus]|uniref:MFS transporter n=1 Tax=Alicyclobacillus fastidiosus TaxID=392011 RepID=A0ABY6ZNB2_9BACL|nr:MFS transporter [Alicyclobacillus fastidiosus]WAH43589.1 MFS transporter [Alicyclobacillus fastidiosus]GMA59771.1 MFS transporter [Alicyclobacillus fastidiosus]
MQRETESIFDLHRSTALLVLGLCEFVRGALIFFIIPMYVHNVLGYSTASIGYAMAAHYVFDTGLRSPAGWLVDRLGQRKVCASLLAVAGIGLWLVITQHAFWIILVGCAMLGMGMAAVWPAVIARVTDGLTKDAYATAMGSVMMAWLLGAGLGAICMSWLFGIHVARGFMTLMVLWVIAYVMGLLVMNSWRPHATVRKRTHLRMVLREVNSVKVLFPGVFVQTFAIGVLLPVLVLYARNVLHLDSRMYSYLLLTGGAAAVLLQVPMGRLVDRFGYRLYLVSGFLLAAISLPIIGGLHQVRYVFLAVILFGAAYALILPSWNAVVAQCISPDKRAVMFGVFMTVEGLGMAVGPVFGTEMWNAFGPSAPFDVAAVIFFVMSVLYGVMRLDRLFVGRQPMTESNQAS